MNEMYDKQAKELRTSLVRLEQQRWQDDTTASEREAKKAEAENVIAAALAAAAQEALEQAAQKFDKSKHSLWKGYLIAEELRALKVQL